MKFNADKQMTLIYFCLLAVFIVSSFIIWADEDLSTYTRLDNFRLIGIVIFQGQAIALVEDQTTETQEFYRAGDKIRDHIIESITAKGVFMKSNEVRFHLPSLMEYYDQHEERRTSQRQSGQDSKKDAPLLGSTFKKRSGDQKTQFLMPVNGRVSSGFGYRRHPMGGSRQFHTGIDIAAPYGEKVLAAAAGRVVLAGRKGGYGKTVIIRHDKKFTTLYGHLSHVVVKYRQKVAQGQVIGQTGSTGISTGPHLHFEIREYNKPVDPFKYLPAE